MNGLFYFTRLIEMSGHGPIEGSNVSTDTSEMESNKERKESDISLQNDTFLSQSSIFSHDTRNEMTVYNQSREPEPEEEAMKPKHSPETLASLGKEQFMSDPFALTQISRNQPIKIDTDKNSNIKSLGENDIVIGQANYKVVPVIDSTKTQANEMENNQDQDQHDRPEIESQTLSLSSSRSLSTSPFTSFTSQQEKKTHVEHNLQNRETLERLFDNSRVNDTISENIGETTHHKFDRAQTLQDQLNKSHSYPTNTHPTNSHVSVSIGTIIIKVSSMDREDSNRNIIKSNPEKNDDGVSASNGRLRRYGMSLR